MTDRKGSGHHTGKGDKLVHISPAIVEKYPRGVHFPAERKKLINHAQSKAAPKNVITLLNKLPEKICTSPIDITKEIGKIE